uniref:SPASM domain-containing protein n=1 Tax=Trichobilharzia regenti TaxID=157069 RepID=A0AA85JU27_TRIRE|nr:unnamed protein product [Trichobilharzia regenti]
MYNTYNSTTQDIENKGIHQIIDKPYDQKYFKELNTIQPDFTDMSLEQLKIAHWRGYSQICVQDAYTPQSEYRAQFADFIKDSKSYQKMQPYCICSIGNPITIVGMDIPRLYTGKCDLKRPQTESDLNKQLDGTAE